VGVIVGCVDVVGVVGLVVVVGVVVVVVELGCVAAPPVVLGLVPAGVLDCPEVF
jgi:hypothetical protein